MQPLLRLISDLARLPAAGAALMCACQIATDLPLSNNVPQYNGPARITATAFYPDSALCTLSVNDLNDARLSVYACFCADTGDTSCNGKKLWPGSCRILDETLGPKQIVLGLDTCCMGTYCGHLHVEDRDRAAVRVPFTIMSLLVDSLNRFPVSAANWALQQDRDSAFIGFDYINKKLRFGFSVAADSTDTAAVSTGLRTCFSIGGDLSAGINFQLRDDMMSGFQVEYYLSTSPVAGPWEGDVAGVFITGLTNQIRFTATSINMQTDSRDVTRDASNFAGRFTITRSADNVDYAFTPGDPRSPPMQMNTLIFPADTAVFVHIRMKVDDRLRSRHCLWSDFEVDKGKLKF